MLEIFKSKQNKQNLSLGIFIPVWNKGELFKICYESLIENLSGLDAVIWIYDNGSDEKTRKYVESIKSNKYKIHKTFFPENMGIPYTANMFAQAVQQACDYTKLKSPEFIMLMDADAYFKKPIIDLVQFCNDEYYVGMISGHNSIEHKPINESHTVINGRNVLLLEKENERMITMIMRKEEFLLCYPFPHYRNRDIDWEITQWNANSLKKRNRRIFVAHDYVLHLGIEFSTWNESKEILASEEEMDEVRKIFKKNNIDKS